MDSKGQWPHLHSLDVTSYETVYRAISIASLQDEYGTTSCAWHTPAPAQLQMMLVLLELA